MKITKEQKKRFNKISDDKKMDTLIDIYKRYNVTIQNLVTLSGFKFDDIVDELKKINIRRCSNSSCEQPLKSWSDFSTSKQNTDGCNPHCRVCCKKQQDDNKEEYSKVQKQWRLDNKDNRQEYNQQYYQEVLRPKYDEDPETIKQKRRESYDRTRDRHLEYSREYYEENKEWKLEYSRQYAQENKDIKAAAAAKRRALKLQATPSYADHDKIKEKYAECQRISEETGIVHHVDHIVPLQGKLVCGFHVEYNLQILEGSENLKKHNSFTDYDIV